MTEEEVEIDQFWRDFYQKKKNASSIMDYCDNFSIDELNCNKNKLLCFLKRLKAKAMKSKDCFSYNMDTKIKPKATENLANAIERINIEINKIDVAMKKRLEKSKQRLEEKKEDYSSRKFQGWYDPSEKVTVERKKKDTYDLKKEIIEEKEIEKEKEDLPESKELLDVKPDIELQEEENVDDYDTENE